MTPSSESFPETLAPSVNGAREARSLVHLPAAKAQTLTAVAIVPMVAVTVWLALTSEHLKWPIASALYWSYFTAAPALIGLYWWRRRPASRFGPLLVIFAIVAWVVSWASSDWPLAFNLAGLAEPVFFAFTLYLLLAFPMGRLEPPAARWLMGVLVFGFLVAYPFAVLLSPVLSAGAALAICAPNCPENVFQIGSDPTLVRVTGKTGISIVLAAVLGVVLLYAVRLRAGTRPQRRALMTVAATTMLFLPAFFAFQLARLLELDPGMIKPLEWAAAAGRVLVPLGFLIALLQAELFAARVLRTLLQRLVARPSPDQWRDEVAIALDDDELRLGYHDPPTGRFREPDGAILDPTTSGSHRVWVPIDRDVRPVAAMVTDETLAEDPELVNAAKTATLLAVENGALEGELQATRARVLEVGDAERRRIERDIHDSAQQRLIALRIHLELAGAQADAPQRATLERLGLEVDEAIDELRGIAQGLYPPILAHAGVGPALSAIARRSDMNVTVSDSLGRQSEAVETALYYCCLECLQNAAKYAGRGASISIRLSQHERRIGFTVEDDGVGFDLDTVERGAGIDNISARVAALGGTLRIDSHPGRGTRVTGHLRG